MWSSGMGRDMLLLEMVLWLIYTNTIIHGEYSPNLSWSSTIFMFAVSKSKARFSRSIRSISSNTRSLFTCGSAKHDDLNAASRLPILVSRTEIRQ
jgi:hypothetical protein